MIICAQAQSLILGLGDVIGDQEHLDYSKTKMPWLIDGDPVRREGFKISLDGYDGARIEIHAFGSKMVAIVVATSRDYLQRIILAIRSWCMGNDLRQFVV